MGGDVLVAVVCRDVQRGETRLGRHICKVIFLFIQDSLCSKRAILSLDIQVTFRESLFFATDITEGRSCTEICLLHHLPLGPLEKDSAFQERKTCGTQKLGEIFILFTCMQRQRQEEEEKLPSC